MALGAEACMVAGGVAGAVGALAAILRKVGLATLALLPAGGIVFWDDLFRGASAAALLKVILRKVGVGRLALRLAGGIVLLDDLSSGVSGVALLTLWYVLEASALPVVAGISGLPWSHAGGCGNSFCSLKDWCCAAGPVGYQSILSSSMSSSNNEGASGMSQSSSISTGKKTTGLATEQYGQILWQPLR